MDNNTIVGITMWIIGALYTMGKVFALYIKLHRPVGELIFMCFGCLILWPFILGGIPNE